MGTVTRGAGPSGVVAVAVMGRGLLAVQRSRLPAASGPNNPKCTVPPVAAEEAERDGTCANCGGPGDGLEEVRRVYVTLDEAGRVTGSETVAGTERWCLACRAVYPHLPATDPPPEGGSSYPGR